jgi:hypothetical protein
MRTLLVLASLTAFLGCAPPEEGEEANSAATIVRSSDEGALARVFLQPEAAERLGIETASVERRRLPRTRRLGGDIVVPTRLPGAEGRPLVVGAALAPADRLHAMDTLITADEAVQRARIDLEAATAALTRAERVQRAEAGSVRSVEEARARRDAAVATLRAAEARRKGLAEATFGGGGTLWVRVPVYVGDLSLVAPARPALVAAIGEPAGAGVQATPVAGPRAGNPDAASVDLFYAVDDRDGRLRPGEKVAVTIELGEADEVPVVPWAAVVHDVHGGEWVYERVAAHLFARRRVQVRYVVGPDAALASGPPVGASVVVAGAAELFGVEFAAGTHE